MVKPTTIAVILSMLLIAACTGGGGTSNLKTFLGGTSGVVITFDTNAPPKQVFDGGDFPFDVAVKLQNKGEFLVTKDKAIVSITGIMPQEFALKEADLKKAPSDDLLQRKTDSSGKVIEPGETFVEFQGLNHLTPVTGSSLNYPIRAEVCYEYGTTAASTLCIRKNLANPEEKGICSIEGTRPLSVSGAPVQIADMREFQRGKDSVGFSFTIKTTTSTTAKIFQLSSMCEGGRGVEDRVTATVRTDIPGLSCQGLNVAQEGTVTGPVPLFGADRTVTCTQRVTSPGDFEMPLTITLSYDYRDYVETTVLVKHAGDSDNSTNG